MSWYKVLLAVLATMVLGLSAVMSKIGLREFSPIVFTMLRFVVVVPAALFISRPTISWKMLVAITLTLSVGHLCLTNIGLFLGASASTYVFIQQSGTLFALFFAYFLLNSKPTRYDLAGSFMGFVGIYLLVAHKTVDATPLALLALITSAIVWALGSTLVKKAHAPSLATSTWSAILAIPFLCVPLASMESVESITQSLSNASLGAWGTVFYSGWVSMLGAGAIIFYLLRTEPVSKVMPLYSLVPLFGALFSITLLGEELNESIIQGGLAIFLGVALSQYGAKIMPSLRTSTIALSLISLPLYGEGPKAIDVAILGSGCAGLSAAFVTAEYGLDTHFFAGQIEVVH